MKIVISYFDVQWSRPSKMDENPIQLPYLE
jgi:hypothetical protein